MKNEISLWHHRNLFRIISQTPAEKNSRNENNPLRINFKSDHLITKPPTGKNKNSKSLQSFIKYDFNSRGEKKENQSESLFGLNNHSGYMTQVNLGNNIKQSKLKGRRSFTSLMMSSFNSSLNKKETADSDHKAVNKEKASFDETQAVENNKIQFIGSLKKKFLKIKQPIILNENLETNEKFSSKNKKFSIYY